jgi:hypothetical protein
MQRVRRLRAMGSMCRQQAAYNPAERWRFIAEAEYWEHLAELELAVHYKECNSCRTENVATGVGSAKPSDTGLETVFAG